MKTDEDRKGVAGKGIRGVADVGISHTTSKYFPICSEMIPLVLDLNTVRRKTEVYLRT